MLHLSLFAILAFSACAWGLQCVLMLWGLSAYLPEFADWPWALKLAMALDVMLGLALAWLMVRALYCQPRRSVQVAAALRKERQRIARELHDHVGSQLVNAMMLLDSPANQSHPVMQTLEQCMLDLRLLVDVMSDHKGNLADKLATLRHRLQPVLDKREMALTWVIESESMEHLLPNGVRARELCRLVQEAVSNVLQHSQATQLEIELRPYLSNTGDEAGDWVLRVADNGVGMPGNAQVGYQGKGIAHMRRRALRAGGHLQIVSREGEGTEILVVVLTKRSAAAASTRG